MPKGIIYVLINEAMPGYIKIGKTCDDIRRRIKSLDNTSIPVPFECFYAAEVEDIDKVEKLIHEAFGDHRVRKNREFFTIGPERVVAVIKLVEIREATPKEEVLDEKEDIEAIQKIRRRRKRFSFEKLGIEKGSVLEFTRDKNITCEVSDNNKVIFNGEEMGLSKAARLAMNSLGYKWQNVSGPLYWEYNGNTIEELRNNIENSDETEE